MAETKNTITIKFKPEGDKGLVSAIRALDTATKRLVSSQTGLTQSSRKVKSGQDQLVDSFKKTGTHTRNLSGTFSVLRSKMLLFNFAMGLGVRQLLSFAKQAASLEDLERAFTTLSGGVGSATEALEDLKNATDGTVSSAELFKQANNAMILGVSKNSKEMAVMFDMAQRLGRALGRDATSSIESFVTGVGRQSRLMLDNIGIIVKTQVAYEAYAMQLNKNVDDLTNVEQKQAFLNATLVAGDLAIRKLGIEVLTSTDELEQMNAKITELNDKIGEQLLPLVLSLTESFTSFLDTISREDIRKTVSAFETLAIAVGAFMGAKGIGGAIGQVARFGIFISKLSPKVRILSGLLSITTSLLGGKLLKSIFDNTDALNKQADATIKINRLQNDYNKNIEQRKVLLDNAAKSQREFNAQVRAAEKIEIDNIKTTTNKLATILKTYTGTYDEIQQKLKDFQKTQSAFASVTSGLTKEEIKNNKELIDSIVENFLAKTQIQEDSDKIEENNIKKAKAGLAIFKAVHGETTQFQLDELSEQRKEYMKHFTMTEAAERIFYKKRNEITEEADREKNEKIKENMEAFREANKTIFANDLEFQLGMLESEYEAYLQMNIKKAEVDEWYENKKKDLVLQKLEETNGLYSAFESSYDTFVNSLTDMDMSRHEREKQIIESSKNALISFLGDIIKEQIKAMIIEKAIQKTSQAESIASSFVLGKAIAANYAGAAALSATATGGATAVAGGASLLATSAVAEGIAKKEDGGLIGGKRHSQGGTIIEAEQGEFIMSRKAVESIGLDTMNQINQGNGGGLTINVSAPLVDETILDVIIPKIQKAQRQNLA